MEQTKREGPETKVRRVVGKRRGLGWSSSPVPVGERELLGVTVTVARVGSARQRRAKGARTTAVHPRGWPDRELLQRLVGVRTRRGNRSQAEATLRETLRRLRHRGAARPRTARCRALRRVRPVRQTQTRKRAGARLPLPVYRPAGRRAGTAVRWLVTAAGKRAGRRRAEKLAKEVRSMLVGRGETLRRQRELHKGVLSARTNRRQV
jgi:small subunit ribosomal protein S7